MPAGFTQALQQAQSRPRRPARSPCRRSGRRPVLGARSQQRRVVEVGVHATGKAGSRRQISSTMSLPSCPPPAARGPPRRRARRRGRRTSSRAANSRLQVTHAERLVRQEAGDHAPAGGDLLAGDAQRRGDLVRDGARSRRRSGRRARSPTLLEAPARAAEAGEHRRRPLGRQPGQVERSQRRDRVQRVVHAGHAERDGEAAAPGRRSVKRAPRRRSSRRSRASPPPGRLRSGAARGPRARCRRRRRAQHRGPASASSRRAARSSSPRVA